MQIILFTFDRSNERNSTSARAMSLADRALKTFFLGIVCLHRQFVESRLCNSILLTVKLHDSKKDSLIQRRVWKKLKFAFPRFSDALMSRKALRRGWSWLIIPLNVPKPMIEHHQSTLKRKSQQFQVWMTAFRWFQRWRELSASAKVTASSKAH